MPVTDSVADLLTRIRNANRALHDYTDVPTSKFNLEILRILKEQGFIRGYDAVSGTKFPTTRIYLKYLGTRRERVITNLKRISKPGLRKYSQSQNLPRVLKGLGIAIVSTSSGLLTDAQAREKGVGGEVVCYVW